jgi:hypothetical protein
MPRAYLIFGDIEGKLDVLRVDERLASKLVEAVRGTVNGTVVVAVAEGLLIGVGYIAAGVPNPLLFTLLTMAFAMPVKRRERLQRARDRARGLAIPAGRRAPRHDDALPHLRVGNSAQYSARL